MDKIKEYKIYQILNKENLKKLPLNFQLLEMAKKSPSIRTGESNFYKDKAMIYYTYAKPISKIISYSDIENENK